MKLKEIEKSSLREALADLEHKQWASWVESVIKRIEDEGEISKEKIKSWKDLMATDYEDLTEEMKDLDREWADKALKLMEKYID